MGHSTRRWLILLCWTVYLVRVESVTDGDTFRAEVAVYPKVIITENIRVLDVDTPERNDLPRWSAARDFTKAWLADSGPTTVTVCKHDSFGRALGKVISTTKGELAAALIQAGHGQPYERRR